MSKTHLLSQRLSPSRPLFLALALLVAGLAAWPLLSEPGLLNTRGGGDSPFLLQRLHQLETAVHDGHFPVRWMPDANYGYGYPFFNYYAPLSLTITAVFRVIGFSYVRAIHLAQLSGFLVAAWGMFQCGRRWWGKPGAGLLTAAAYTLAPFHLVNVYVRGDSLAEFWAMAFYPLVLLACENAIQAWQTAPPPHTSHRTRSLALVALSYAGLILSHNISALIFTPVVGLYIAGRWWQAARSSQTPASGYGLRHHLPLLGLMGLALTLALALAAWFFVPALAEQSSAQLGPVTEGYFHYSAHFRQADLVQTSFFFDYDPNGGQAFRMGLVQALTAVLGLVAFWYCRRGEDRLVRYHGAFAVIILLLASFMITPLSRPLWQHLPLLSFTQFPWRFLSVQAVGAALVTGAVTLLPWRRLLVPFLVVLLLVSSLGWLQTDHLLLTDADVTAERLAQYEWFTGNIGSTVSAEYLPPTVQPRPYTSPWLITGERYTVTALAGTLLAGELAAHRTGHQAWRIETADTATLIFPTLYWPGWQAAVDGETAVIRPAPGSGLIMVDVPAGSHTVQLHLGRTAVRLLAELVSLVALIIVGWLLQPKPRRTWAYGLLPLLLLSLGLRLLPDRQLRDGTLTWDFAQMGYLHHDERGIPFEPGNRLDQYTYSQETITAGQTLTITATWQEASGRASVALYTPAVNRTGQAGLPTTPAIVSQTQPLQAGQVHFTLPIPDNAPAGLYVPRLTLTDGQALMPSGRTRGPLFLRPIRIVSPPVLEEGQRLEAKAVQGTFRDDGALTVQLAWLTPRPIGPNYVASLRLIDGAGGMVAQVDQQPGYGFLPSSSWPPGQWVNDWLTIPLPEAAPAPAVYALVVRLYDVAADEVALVRRLGQVVRQEEEWVFQPHQPRFVVPDVATPLTAVWGNTIQLHGFDLHQAQDTIDLTFYWQAVAATPTDYVRFVHLIEAAAGGALLAQDDSMPRYNSHPTSQWVVGEVVSDSLTLLIDDVPPGVYRLMVGFYHQVDDQFPRLTVVDAAGHPLRFDQVVLPVEIVIDNDE